MKIIVYFENNQFAEEVGVYNSEEDYMDALPYLESKAAEYRMWVTESVID